VRVPPAPGRELLHLFSLLVRDHFRQGGWLVNRHNTQPQYGASPLIIGSDVQEPKAGSIGVLTARQEWVTSRLRALYEASGTSTISENDLKNLINSTVDWIPYWLHRNVQTYGSVNRNWFQQAKVYATTFAPPSQVADIHALMDEFDAWAANADLKDTSQTPLKWHVFWFRFREDVSSPISNDPQASSLVPQVDRMKLFAGPFEYYWPHPQTTTPPTLPGWFVLGVDQVGSALVQAAIGTIYDFGVICPFWRLDDLLTVKIPFRNTTTSTWGSSSCLKLLSYTPNWSAGWTSCLKPERQVDFAGRLPMLVRLPKVGQGRKVWLMTNGLPTDLLSLTGSLPEWSGAAGLARYDEGMTKMGALQLYDLPLTKSQLTSLPNPWSVTVTNSN